MERPRVRIAPPEQSRQHDQESLDDYEVGNGDHSFQDAMQVQSAFIVELEEQIDQMKMENGLLGQIVTKLRADDQLKSEEIQVIKEENTNLRASIRTSTQKEKEASRLAADTSAKLQQSEEARRILEQKLEDMLRLVQEKDEMLQETTETVSSTRESAGELAGQVSDLKLRLQHSEQLRKDAEAALSTLYESESEYRARLQSANMRAEDLARRLRSESEMCHEIQLSKSTISDRLVQAEDIQKKMHEQISYLEGNLRSLHRKYAELKTKYRYKEVKKSIQSLPQDADSVTIDALSFKLMQFELAQEREAVEEINFRLNESERQADEKDARIVELTKLLEEASDEAKMCLLRVQRLEEQHTEDVRSIHRLMEEKVSMERLITKLSKARLGASRMPFVEEQQQHQNALMSRSSSGVASHRR